MEAVVVRALRIFERPEPRQHLVELDPSHNNGHGPGTDIIHPSYNSNRTQFLRANAINH
jgi:hypothetical protein